MIRPGAKLLQEENKKNFLPHNSSVFLWELFRYVFVVSYSKSTILPILPLLKETLPKSCDIKENVCLNFTVQS